MPSETAIAAARHRPATSPPPRQAPAFVNNRFLCQMQSEGGTLIVCKRQQLMQTVCFSRRPKDDPSIGGRLRKQPPHSTHQQQHHHECPT